MSKIYDDGVAYCDAQPDLLVAAVWQEARMHYQSLIEQTEFVNGYISERTRRDENRRPVEEADESDQDRGRGD